jgi:hypothetical protein
MMAEHSWLPSALAETLHAKPLAGKRPQVRAIWRASLRFGMMAMIHCRLAV